MFYLTILIVHVGHDQIARVNNSNWEYCTWALCKLHVTCITFVDYGGVDHQQKIVQFLGNMNGSFGKSMGNATLRVVKQICELELQKH
jgi:hypothetical protein